jgi:hypothetical protein
MRCSRVIESCGSEWFQSALTATISTTPAWNHSISRSSSAPELAILDDPRATFSHMFPGTEGAGHSSVPSNSRISSCSVPNFTILLPFLPDSILAKADTVSADHEDLSFVD